MLRRMKLRKLSNALLYISVILLLSVFPGKTLHAEGSWQMGLFEGLTYRQPIYNTDVGAKRNILYVDILAAGEVINVLACGINDSNTIRVQIVDPFGAIAYDVTAPGNVTCSNDFDTTFDPAGNSAHQHVTSTSGTYQVRLTNQNSNRLDRYDVTVTDNVNEAIDPRENGGRLWSDYWYFWAGSFAESRSTDADLYVVADGGFVGTYFIWKLDLNNFAGYGYGLKANDLGVVSPNSAGDIVAGLSVPSSGNAINAKYPIYLSYPDKNYPTPSQSFTVSELEFKDSSSTDNAITSSDNGTFSFETDLTTTGVYEIIIDISDSSGGEPDGIYGQGDIYLRGTAVNGENVIPWNGKDNNGVDIPLGVYSARLGLRTGEFHFVADDVETSGGPGNQGLKIYKAQSDGSESPTAIYWDDLTVLGSTEPDAFNQTGIYNGDHNWGQFNSGGIGNATLIDTYAFAVNVSPTPTPIAIVEDDTPLANIIKSFTPDTIAHGELSNMQFVITNPGTDPLSGITVSDTMPSGMTLATDPAAITVTGTGCTNFVFSNDTVAGGDLLNIVDGNIAAETTCTISADVTAVMPGELVNSTSGVTANELSFGIPSNNATLFVNPEASGTALLCDSTMYQSENSGSSSLLYRIDTSTNPFTKTEFSGPDYLPSATYQYTGLAFNPADNYLYGIVTESDAGLGDPVVGSVVRIDSEGKVVNIGLPEMGPNTMKMPEFSDRFVGGTMTPDGNLVVVTDTSAMAYSGGTIPADERGLIVEIDVSVNPPQVLFNWQHGRDVGDIAAFTDGRLLTHTPAEGLMQIDSQTGDVTVIGGDVTQTLSSLMVNSMGQLYAHTENTNELLSINALNGEAILTSSLPGGVTADGASCSYGLGVQKSVSQTEVSAGDTVTYELSIVNGGATSVSFDLIDNLQDARAFVSGSLVNPLGGGANAYGDSSILSITGASIDANSIATISFDVLYSAGVNAGPSLNQAQIQIAGMPLIQSDYSPTLQIGDATPIEVLPVPGIGASKRALVSGTDVTYWFTLANTGAGEVDELSLVDDLDVVFGAGNYAIAAPPVLETDPGTVIVNPLFNGTGSGATLIEASSGSTLAEGTQATIRLTITVSSVTDRGAGYGVYSNQVDFFAMSESGDVISDLSVDGDSVDPDGNGIAQEQSPTVISMQQAFSVTGYVFEDNGALSAVAHDAVQGSNEPPLTGVMVELRDSSNILVDSIATDSSGRYEITIPITLNGQSISIAAQATSGYLSISESSSIAVSGNVTDSVVSFTADTATATTYNIDFGRIRSPSWLDNNVVENNPGAVALHPHQYRANTSGQLSFSFSNQSSSPANTDFSATIIRDESCNGVLDSGDAVLSGSIAVNSDTGLVCIINKVIIPANASANDTFSTTLGAQLIYSDATLSGHSVSSYLELTDITRSLVAGEGILVLEKTVQNLSAGSSQTVSNSASPNDVLRYKVDFNNNGTGPVTEVLIADGTPAYSTLEVPVQCPLTLPNGIVACRVLMPSTPENSSGYYGPVRWQFDGSLPAGATGTVYFDIRVD